jgi:hypothetical protein
MTQPTPIDESFEQEARRTLRTCWVCKRQFNSQDEMQTHKAKAHPNWRPPMG